MSVINKTVVLDNISYHRVHINLVNNFLPSRMQMTDKECAVISAFLSVDKKITEDDMFNTLARKHAKSILDGMSPASLSNHIKNLIEKGILDKNELSGKIKIKPFLIPGTTQQIYNFKIGNEEAR